MKKIGRVAIDHVLDRPHTDPKRVALMGISYGGYFAIRIAANDARVKALIPNSPILDLHSYMTSFAGLDAAEMPDENDFRLADLEHIPDEVMPPQLREMAGNLMRRMGRDSFKQTYIRLREYRVSESDLKRIVCPALALVGAGEGEEPIAQAKRFRAGVGGPVAAHIFTPEEGADGHCQTANLAYSAAVSMDWLDETFA
ncbi:MAG: S9 family peptidase [Kiritimatiellae bacterium]|nr:S9 family peptidase [Kiritimatiellia bacterium]